MNKKPTPLMNQYQEIKSKNPGIILFFRLGDFYEMFGEDAKKASPILEVTLTKRQGYPMCGIPYHAANSYLRKLIKAGEKVAVCEQLEEAKPGAGIVKRGVVRVITPGTILEDNLLEAKQSNYLLSICADEKINRFGLAFIDISTGEFKATELDLDTLKQEVFRLSPQEIIMPQSLDIPALHQKPGITITSIDDWQFSASEAHSKITQFFKVKSLKPFGLSDRNLAAAAAGGILAYVEKTQPALKENPFSGINYYSLDNCLLLDEIAIKNLELVLSQSTNTRENSLLDVIDLTLTPMGGRTIRQWLLRPLLSKQEIIQRQQAVEFFIEEGMQRRQARLHLKTISDIERILNRIASGSAGPRELIGLKISLEALPEIKKSLKSSSSLADPGQEIDVINKGLSAPPEISGLISSSISDEPPVTLKDGGVIKTGFSAELDELRKIKSEGKSLISAMEADERRKTGINTLKIGYTSVFGYYIEITKSNLTRVPDNYTRRQTLANAERFITPELKSFEEKVLSAEDKILKLESALFKDVRDNIFKYSDTLREISAAVAKLDIFASLAEVAVLYNYCKPEIDESLELSITDGRHPVIERKLQSGSFVPNDVYLDDTDNQIILLTGPNMAGKSTYLRQVALISILAQIGSYVPAAKARLGILDRIFTRIGAADNLAGGESTFMVEMHETANILHQHTQRSLIILDEVGRGTSTYDGISIAWSTVEYLSGKKPKVLFATHYFELTDLEGKLPGIRNYNVSVKEWQNDVVFLHKIVEGAADRSYGIHVAQLAGLPDKVIGRAKRILSELEAKPQLEEKSPGSGSAEGASQLEFFAPLDVPSSNILLELDKLDINSTTPLDALKLLEKWKK